MSRLETDSWYPALRSISWSMKRLLLVIWLCVPHILCAGAEDRDAEKIRIGVVYGFTGAAQVWSEYGRMGLELAQEEINGAGGVYGKEIELIFEDSRSTPAGSVAAYKKLVSINRVGVVIGIFGLLSLTRYCP